MIPFLAVAVGVIVTASLHESDGFWSRRLGRSRFRRANLPVGGALALLLGLATGSSTAYTVAAAFTYAAVGWRYVDPLPPVETREEARHVRPTAEGPEPPRSA